MKAQSVDGKGQVFTWDIVLASIVLMFILLIVLSQWDQVIQEMTFSETQNEVSWLSTAVSEQLVRTAGTPYNWTADPWNENNIIGLAATEEIEGTFKARARVLDPDKVLHFINLSQDYNWSKNKLMGASNYEYYAEFSCIEGSNLDCFNGMALKTIDNADINCSNETLFYIRDNTVYTALNQSGLWRFDEGAGTTARDSSGNKHDGTLLNGVSWVEGKSGNAIALDGTDDYALIPDYQPINALTDNFSIFAWIKPDSLSGVHSILSLTKGAPYPLLFFHTQTSQVVMSIIDDSGAPYAVSVTGLIPGAWQHVGFVKNGGQGTLYLNGVSTTSAVGPTGSFTANRLVIGGDSSYMFDGAIDEVKIFKRALTPEQVQGEYIRTSIPCLIGLNGSLSESTHVIYDTKTAVLDLEVEEGEIKPLLKLTLTVYRPSQAGEKPVSLVATCHDTDAFNSFVLGEVSGLLEDGSPYTNEDYCTIDGKVVEYYCVEGRPVARPPMPCAGGCSGGRCI